MLTAFLFWNLNRKPLQDFIRRLIRVHNVEVIVLAESPIPHVQILQTLNAQEGTWFHVSDSECKALNLYTRFPPHFLKACSENSRMTIRHMSLPARTDIILVAAHFISKLHWSDASQSFECQEIVREIEKAEKVLNNKRTLFIGDLNMNPFESGLVSANGFNAVMARGVASRQTRTVQGRTYQFFYNPMWGHLGDRGKGPPGTYYQARPEHVTYFWNIFDQVLLRPELLSSFQNGDTQILTTDGITSFLNDKGFPNTSIVSDHLPVLVKLDL